MATSDRAQLRMELSREAVPMAAMLDSGDHQIFTLDGVHRWSGHSVYAPDIRPNGVISGRNILSPGTGDNELLHGPFSAYANGVKYEVAAGTAGTITRPASDVAKVNSVIMRADGTLAVIAGDDGLDPGFSETRGEVGGPPEIPADAVELGQVRVAAAADAVITDAELYQVEGEHVERFDNPMWESPNTLGDGLDAETPAQKHAYLRFAGALPTIHTGGTVKRVYAKVFAPMMAIMQRVKDFVPAETSHSSSSEEYYGGAVAAASESLGQSSFTALTGDNITDAIVRQKNQIVTVQFFPDRNKSAYLLTQGKLGIARTFNIGAQNAVACTQTSAQPSVGFGE